jgi:hypothetical protein
MGEQGLFDRARAQDEHDSSSRGGSMRCIHDLVDLLSIEAGGELDEPANCHEMSQQKWVWICDLRRKGAS